MKNRKKRKWAGVLVAALLCLMFVQERTPAVHAQEETRRVKVPIYHKHAGNSQQGGGCYGQELPHIHQGGEEQGGACYGKALYHVHEGNAQSGGGCYAGERYHCHEGNSTEGGACYQAQFHSHGEECREETVCIIDLTKGELIETYTAYCFAHKNYPHERSYGTETHRNCGAGQVQTIMTYCKTCGYITPIHHSYEKIVCGKEDGESEGYVLSCEQSEEEVIGFELSCGKQEGDLEGYALTCGLTIEGYGLSCGLQQGQLCGNLILQNETEGEAKEVVLSAALEDVTGTLKRQGAFCWYGPSGESLGTGEQIRVDQNGAYKVCMLLQNQDVDQSSVEADIVIGNVAERGESPTATPEPTATLAPVGSPTPAASKSPTKDTDQEKPEATKSPGESLPTQTPGEQEQGEEETPVPTPTQTPLPPSETEQIPPEAEQEPPNAGEKTGNGQKIQMEEIQEETEEEPQREKVQIIKKEKIERPAEERNAPAPEGAEPEKISSVRAFFERPAVKIVTITTGSLLFIFGILSVLFYFRRSVRLYHDNGEGKFLFLERCLLHMERDGMAVTISKRAAESSLTNRYCIKPGLAGLGTGRKELLIHKGKGRLCVPVERKMIFVIPEENWGMDGAEDC